MTATEPDTAEYVDVVIVGAGISGIGAAYRISERNPGMDYVILERRQRIGARGIYSATPVSAVTAVSSR